MSGDQSVAGMRRYLAEVVGKFAAMEFDRMLDEARREALTDACDAIAVLISERGIHLGQERAPMTCPVCGGAGIVDTSPPGVEERP